MSPRRCVVHILTQLELGGAQENTLFSCGEAIRRGWEAHLITSSGELIESARSIKGLQLHLLSSLVRPIRPWTDLRAYFQVRHLLRQINPSIVHTHSSKAGIVGREAARSEKIPIILHTVHGWGFTPGQPVWLKRLLVAAEQREVRFTDRLIVVADDNRRKGLLNRIGDYKQYVTIRSGVDVRAFQERQIGKRAAKERLGINPDRLVVGTIANFKPQKDPMTFLKVAEQVCAKEPRALFVYAGDGLLRPRFEGLVQEKKLNDHVKVLGWRRDTAEVMSAFDVFLLTSRWEGLPRTLIESAALAIPAVACAVDGVSEILKEGEGGYPVPVGDVPLLSERVLELLTNPARASHFGEALRQRAFPEFDIHTMGNRLFTLYEELLESCSERSEGRGKG